MLWSNQALGFGGGASGRGELPITANLWAHWRADAENVAKSADLVSQWNDLSGNGYHLTESTNKPLWVDGLINGHPAVRFDGSNDELTKSSVTGPGAPMHIFFVFNHVSWTVSDTLFRIYDKTSIHNRTSSPNIGLDSGYFSKIAHAAVGTFGLLNAVYRSSISNSQMALNDASYTTVNGRTVHSTGTMSLGSHGNGTNFANIEVAELIVFSDEKTGSDLTDIKNYINTEYALW